MDERTFEDIICKYPELIENNLLFKGRQVTVSGKRVDVLFEDRHGHLLILEIKKGTVLRKDLGQLLDYEGYYVSGINPNVRVMLVGNRVPESFKRSLDHYGIEWKELTIPDLINFIKTKDNPDILKMLTSDGPLLTNINEKHLRHRNKITQKSSSFESNQLNIPSDITSSSINEINTRLIIKETNTLFRQTDHSLSKANPYFTLSRNMWKGIDGDKNAIVYFSKQSNNIVFIPRKAVDMYIFDPLFQKTPTGYYLKPGYKKYSIDKSDRIGFMYKTKGEKLIVILKATLKYHGEELFLFELPNVYWPKITVDKNNINIKLIEIINRLCHDLSNCDGIVSLNDMNTRK